jgi:hypothetical protein
VPSTCTSGSKSISQETKHRLLHTRDHSGESRLLYYV